MPKVRGCVSLPGDKSISHRAALFSALRPGVTSFTNFNFNQDCSATLNCLQQLGIKWSWDGNLLQIWGRSLKQWQKPTAPLDAQNSGTTARLISGLLTNLPFETELTGDASLCKRPMERVINPLKLMGAEIDSIDGHLPLHFYPATELKPIVYSLPMASAQVKSCVLLAGLFNPNQTQVIEFQPSRDHTERMLALPSSINPDGSKSYFSSNSIEIPDLSMCIPGDFSSAAFFISAALLLTGSELTLENVSLNPSRTGLLSVLQAMGAQIITTLSSKDPEPAGDIHIQSTTLSNTSVPADLIPNIIDEIPILTILATQSAGKFHLRHAKELRFKESDRIGLMVENLRTIGVEVDEFDDGFAFNGPCKLKGGTIRTAGDHRIAMSFAIANYLTDETIQIDQPDCVAVSFPSFWNILENIIK